VTDYELIEKVAMAICRARYGHLRGFYANREQYEKEAHAAIAASHEALRAENTDLVEQLVIRSESNMAKTLNGIMRVNNSLHSENEALRVKQARMVEAARPFAYLMEGDFYPTEREVKRLRAAIEEVNHARRIHSERKP
jgi:hypothetical protein